MKPEFNKNKPFRKSAGKGFKKPFNPNKDLENAEGSFSERKRNNLLEEKRKAPFEKGKPPYEKRKPPFEKGKSFEKRKAPFEKEKPPYEKRKPPFEKGKPSFEKEKSSFETRKYPFKRDSYTKTKDPDQGFNKTGEKKSESTFRRKKTERSKGYRKLTEQRQTISDGLIRLNKYISNAGICSRREADELIKAGVVKVNGKIITEMGYKVKPDDVINYGGETLRKEKLVYVLLNKPKDFITTLDDPGKRKTVYDLIKNACRERIYPVGRLDRNTTGVLLLTNDGDLTKKLTHPKHGIKKIYQVTLDKPLGRPDLEEISKNGVTLDDGHILPDTIQYSGDGSNKKEIGLEIHSGRNRIVRRLFEQLGYEVVKLDRVVFAGLTKKDLPRGNWRLLTEQEVGFLKMLT